MARDGNDRQVAYDESGYGYGDTGMQTKIPVPKGDNNATNDAPLPPKLKIPEMGDGSGQIKKKKKKTKNPAAKKQPIKADANASIPVNGLAGRMNGM